MKLEQAARQALEALEEAYAAQFETTWFEIKPEHFTALREVLAEPAVAEEAKTTSGMNSFERQEFLYRQSQDFKKSQGGNGW